MSTAGALRRSRSPIARVCVLTASDTALVLEGRLAQLLPDSSFHAKAAEAFLLSTRTSRLTWALLEPFRATTIRPAS
jgi:hypothetical protein